MSRVQPWAWLKVEGSAWTACGCVWGKGRLCHSFSWYRLLCCENSRLSALLSSFILNWRAGFEAWALEPCPLCDSVWKFGLCSNWVMLCKFHNKKELTYKKTVQEGGPKCRSGKYREQNLEGTPQEYLHNMNNEIIGKVISLWYLSVFSDFSKLRVLRTLVIVGIFPFVLPLHFLIASQ